MLGKWEDVEELEEITNKFLDSHANEEEFILVSSEVIKLCNKLKPKHALIPMAFKAEDDELYCGSLEVCNAEGEVRVLIDDFMENSIKDEEIADSALNLIKSCLTPLEKTNFTSDSSKNQLKVL